VKDIIQQTIMMLLLLLLFAFIVIFKTEIHTLEIGIMNANPSTLKVKVYIKKLISDRKFKDLYCN